MYVAVSLSGIEDIAAKEIKELLNAESENILDGRVLFNAENIEGLKNSKSIDRVYFLLKKFNFKDAKEIYEEIKKIDFKGSIRNKRFRVQCNRIGEHNFKSVEIEKNAGEAIFEKGFRVDLKNPDVIVYIEIIDNECLIGILNLDDLRKRDYRIKAVNMINSCLAYSLVRLSRFNEKMILVDPFCVDGVICIESCFCDGEIYGLCKNEHELRNSTVNAKLAGVYGKLKFLVGDLGCLSTNFKENSVDRIITSLRGKEDIMEFFRQANYILKKNGNIILLCLDSKVKDIAEDFGFVVEERNVFAGSLKYYILILNKKNI